MIRFSDPKPSGDHSDTGHGAAGFGPRRMLDNGVVTTFMSGYRAVLAIRMSPRMFYLDFVIYPVMVLVFVMLALNHATLQTALFSGGIFLSGYVLWTLLEYGVHRFALHHLPGLEAIHNAHHDGPQDMIGTPTLVSLAAFIVLGFAPAMALVGLSDAAAWMAGLLTGYLLYIIVYYAVHHNATGKSRWMAGLKRHDALHHYRDGQTNFGVTSRIWDRVFGTLAG